MSGSDAFLYGAIGAVIALLVVHVLPFAWALLGGASPMLSTWRVIGALLVLGIFIAVGGVISILLVEESDDAKQAIAYGLGWQASIGGFIQGTRAEG